MCFKKTYISIRTLRGGKVEKDVHVNTEQGGFPAVISNTIQLKVKVSMQMRKPIHQEDIKS